MSATIRSARTAASEGLSTSGWMIAKASGPRRATVSVLRTQSPQSPRGMMMIWSDASGPERRRGPIVETVQFDRQHGDPDSGAVRQGQHLQQLMFEHLGIAESGQRIELDQAPELMLRGFLDGQFADRHDVAARVGTIAPQHLHRAGASAGLDQIILPRLIDGRHREAADQRRHMAGPAGRPASVSAMAHRAGLTSRMHRPARDEPLDSGPRQGSARRASCRERRPGR